MKSETEGSWERLLNILQSTCYYTLEDSYVSGHRLVFSGLKHFSLIPAIPQPDPSPKRPDRLQGSPSHQFSGYRGMVPSGGCKEARA